MIISTKKNTKSQTARNKRLHAMNEQTERNLIEDKINAKRLKTVEVKKEKNETYDITMADVENDDLENNNNFNMVMVHHKEGKIYLDLDPDSQKFSPDAVTFSVSRAKSILSNGIFYRACPYNLHDPEQQSQKATLCVNKTRKQFVPRLFFISQHDAPDFLPLEQQGFLCAAVDEQAAMTKMGKLLISLKGSSSIRYHETEPDVVEIIPEDFSDKRLVSLT